VECWNGVAKIHPVDPVNSVLMMFLIFPARPGVLDEFSYKIPSLQDGSSSSTLLVLGGRKSRVSLSTIIM
jgi:hypothetical protein